MPSYKGTRRIPGSGSKNARYMDQKASAGFKNARDASNYDDGPVGKIFRMEEKKDAETMRRLATKMDSEDSAARTKPVEKKAKGGRVRGAGCATKGYGKAR